MSKASQRIREMARSELAAMDPNARRLGSASTPRANHMAPSHTASDRASLFIGSHYAPGVDDQAKPPAGRIPR